MPSQINQRTNFTSNDVIQRTSKIRVEILRQGGAKDRASNSEWKGRSQFMFDLEKAETLADILSCTRQLEEAKFEDWSPDLELTCPCCIERTLPDGLDSGQYLKLLRSYVVEYAEKIGLDSRKPDEVASYIWDKFSTVDCSGSDFGYCSLTHICNSSEKVWARDHKLVCKMKIASNEGYLVDSVMNQHQCLSKVQFAEALTQILALRMTWRTFSILFDSLAQATKLHDRIHFSTFFEKVVAHQPTVQSCTFFKHFSKRFTKFLILEEWNASALINQLDRYKSGKILSSRFREFYESKCKHTLQPKEISHLWGDYSSSGDSKTLSVSEFKVLLADIFLSKLVVLDKKYSCCSSTSVTEKRMRYEYSKVENFLQSIYSLQS